MMGCTRGQLAREGGSVLNGEAGRPVRGARFTLAGDDGRRVFLSLFSAPQARLVVKGSAPTTASLGGSPRAFARWFAWFTGDGGRGGRHTYV
jgi:hypothetical protein